MSLLHDITRWREKKTKPLTPEQEEIEFKRRGVQITRELIEELTEEANARCALRPIEKKIKGNKKKAY